MYFAGINYCIISSILFIANGKELRERYFWNEFDFQFETPESRRTAIESKDYIPENCVPSGIEVWTDKVFISIPRYKIGVPSTLNYINLNTTEKSPLLTPYPNWHENNVRTGSLKSLHHLNIDHCQRLWSVDDSPDSSLSSHPLVITIDLKTSAIRKYNLTKETTHESSFTNIIVDVEESNCNEAFAYIADSRSSALVVYSLKDDLSWRISHPYFLYDPLSTNYRINDITYSQPLGLIGLTLSNKRRSGYRDLYFHPGSSTRIFTVSTKILRNSSAANSYENFKVLGDKGTDMQSYASYFHHPTGILFYNIINKNAIGCWNAKKFPNEFSDATNDIVARNDTSLVFIIDLRSDDDENLWILSNKLPLLTKKGFRKDEVNFRIFSTDVKSIVNGTVCDETRTRNKLQKTTLTYY